MKSPACEMFEIEFPLFAFTHCRSNFPQPCGVVGVWWPRWHAVGSTRPLSLRQGTSTPGLIPQPYPYTLTLT